MEQKERRGEKTEVDVCFPSLTKLVGKRRQLSKVQLKRYSTTYYCTYLPYSTVQYVCVLRCRQCERHRPRPFLTWLFEWCKRQDFLHSVKQHNIAKHVIDTAQKLLSL